MDILIWCTLVYHMEIMEIKDGSSGRSQGWSKKKIKRCGRRCKRGMQMGGNTGRQEGLRR